MYYIYYNNTGAITAVANITDESFGQYYIEVDLQTYTDFSNSVKQTLDYIVIENTKIKGKMHIVLKDIDMSKSQMQSTGIIVKQSTDDNAIILNQDLTNGTWAVTNTMDDELCALFAQGEDYVKEYYVVKFSNRFILLDTLRVNLKTLALQDSVTIETYDTEICKQRVSLLCSSHHVKHIHNIQEQ
tara:strand:+ start:1896 stop:2453 length:558 start_codon:yes stop_codon:yes gene_type:complete